MTARAGRSPCRPSAGVVRQSGRPETHAVKCAGHVFLASPTASPARSAAATALDIAIPARRLSPFACCAVKTGGCPANPPSPRTHHHHLRSRVASPHGPVPRLRALLRHHPHPRHDVFGQGSLPARSGRRQLRGTRVGEDGDAPGDRRQPQPLRPNDRPSAGCWISSSPSCGTRTASRWAGPTR